VVKAKSESLAAVRDEDEHPVVPIDASAGQLLALYEPLDIDRLVRENSTTTTARRVRSGRRYRFGRADRIFSRVE
jgi:hypothetical protein